MTIYLGLRWVLEILLIVLMWQRVWWVVPLLITLRIVIEELSMVATAYLKKRSHPNG